MNAFISYVIQEGKEHSHHSEVIEILSPPYSYSPFIDGSIIMDWAANKQKTLKVDQQVIVLYYFKL